VKEIQEGSTNIYQDLGYPDADKMQVKAALAAKIGDIIKKRRFTQTQAGEILGITQPKLSAMLRGQFRGISEAKMIESLNRLVFLNPESDLKTRSRAPESRSD
jgi:predicted XRE-type DNA-binding protein